MKVYFGGVERPNNLHTLARAGGHRIMLSFAEPPTENCWKIIREYRFEILLDSGAFSAWKRGLRIELSDYMDYIQKYHINKYFNLDVVGNPEATAKNQIIMEAAGFNPIPVFHYGEPWELLDQLVAKYPLIGLGGTVGLPLREKEYWFRCVFTRHPEGNFHGLGFANEKLLKQFPFASTDSVWWIYKFRDKQKKFASGEDRKSEQAARVKHLLRLEQTNTLYQSVLFM